MATPEPLANFYGLSTVDLDSKRFFLFIVQTAKREINDPNEHDNHPTR